MSLKGLEIFRVQETVSETQRQTKVCDFDDCTQTTRENKAFCTDHIEKQPYVQDLMKRMLAREQEDFRVRCEGSVSVNFHGITVNEILLHLRQSGPRTEERLQRELQLEKSILYNYIIALQKKGLV